MNENKKREELEDKIKDEVLRSLPTEVLEELEQLLEAGKEDEFDARLDKAIEESGIKIESVIKQAMKEMEGTGEELGEEEMSLEGGELEIEKGEEE